MTRVVSVVAATATIVVMMVGGVGAAPRIGQPMSKNVNISRLSGNQAEEAVAVNPTNPDNIVTITNVQFGRELFEGISFDGGRTWSRRIIADGDTLGFACCDPSLSWDQYGNLFFTYLFLTANGSVPARVPVALSTDGGRHWQIIAQIKSIAPTRIANAKGAVGIGSGRVSDFPFVDQPTVTTGAGSVWVVFNGGPMYAAGASVAGLGQVGKFSLAQKAPGTGNCTFGDVAIGPSGQVMQVCEHPSGGEGPHAQLYANLDPDGVGSQGFGSRFLINTTNVGGFDFIPPQNNRSVDSEAGLAWDRTGGPNDGRLYFIYTDEFPDESGNTDVFLRYTDDNGAHWTPPLQVNDDTTTKAQFLPKISLDPTSGNVAITWHDARLDHGQGGVFDSDGLPNTDATYWGTFSVDGGNSVLPNVQISKGASNAAQSHNGVEYGDYSGLSFVAGEAHPVWADNSDSTGDNPDGIWNELDVYTAAVPVAVG